MQEILTARPHIRWMIRRDMDQVVKLATLSQFQNWDEEKFLECLRQRNCIGMVAERGENVVGFLIYELHKDKLSILNVGWQDSGVFKSMLDKLKDKLSVHLRTAADLKCSDRCDDLHIELRANLFLANICSDDREMYYFKHVL